MTPIIRETTKSGVDELVPLLLLAESTPSRLQWSLANLSDAVYRMDDDGALVGVATVSWRDDDAEIVELAIAPERQGRGFGKQLVAWLVDEARRRGKRGVIVGTSNASLDNIAFYQKCGFRMHAVRPDYFWYHDTPEVEFGIVLRDMIVFRMDLSATRPGGGG